MATENTTTNEKKVTVSQLKKALERANQERDKAISTAVGDINPGTDEVATDEEIDAMLNEVFGTNEGGES